LLAEKLLRWAPVERSGRISAFVVAIMQGTAIQARDGYRRRALQIVVDEALKAIPNDASA